MTSTARRFFVEGRVQGVFFRGSTQAKAAELGLSGYAINLADGRVEVLAAGTASAVAALAEWLQDGPPHARVDDVTMLHVDREPPTGFRTG